jgi:hypothetical protein
LLSQVPLPGQKVYGAVVSTGWQLAALGDSDLTALTVLRLTDVAWCTASDELLRMLTASMTNLVWLSLPPLLPASIGNALDCAGLKGVRILEMR